MLATFYHGKTPIGQDSENLIRKTLLLYLKESIGKEPLREKEKTDYEALINSESVVIQRTEKGKPYFVIDDTKLKHLNISTNIHFSISHTGMFWICLMAGELVGIDIQEQRKVSGIRIADRFFSEEEKEYIRNHGNTAFFRIWTMKEAFVKCIGEGIGYGFDKFSVVKDGKLKESVENIAINQLNLAMEIGRINHTKTEDKSWPYGTYCTRDLTKIKFLSLNGENNEDDRYTQ